MLDPEKLRRPRADEVAEIEKYIADARIRVESDYVSVQAPASLEDLVKGLREDEEADLAARESSETEREQRESEQMLRLDREFIAEREAVFERTPNFA